MSAAKRRELEASYSLSVPRVKHRQCGHRAYTTDARPKENRRLRPLVTAHRDQFETQRYNFLRAQRFFFQGSVPAII
eukprot:2370193-Rhodomonas_salina.1